MNVDSLQADSNHRKQDIKSLLSYFKFIKLILSFCISPSNLLHSQSEVYINIHNVPIKEDAKSSSLSGTLFQINRKCF